MAEFPALPLWTDAYFGDTRHLTTIQHGAYLLILFVSWRNGGDLPYDEKLLARYAGLSISQWNRMKAVILPFFKIKNGRIFQPRLRDELDVVRQQRNQRADNGRASALKRKERNLAQREQSDSLPLAPTLTLTPTPKKDMEYEDILSSERPSDQSQSEDLLAGLEPPKPPEPPKEEPITPEEIFETWNEVAEEVGLPKAVRLTKKRRVQMKARIRENNLGDFRKVFKAIKRSAFLTGDNPSGWRANIDFMLQPSSFTKILEGGYDAQANERQRHARR
jgi:uncharacterized protein YdaU (DUF1376 family)